MRRTRTTVRVSLRASMTGADADRFLSRRQAGGGEAGANECSRNDFLQRLPQIKEFE